MDPVREKVGTEFVDLTNERAAEIAGLYHRRLSAVSAVFGSNMPTYLEVWKGSSFQGKTDNKTRTIILERNGYLIRRWTDDLSGSGKYNLEISTSNPEDHLNWEGGFTDEKNNQRLEMTAVDSRNQREVGTLTVETKAK